MIPEDHLEGFQAYRPRPKVMAPSAASKPLTPVFGRRVKKYSNRL